MAEGKLHVARFEAFQKLDDEIEKLRRNRRKRQMTIERRSKRDQRSEARRRDDRWDPEHEAAPRHRRTK